MDILTMILQTRDPASFEGDSKLLIAAVREPQVGDECQAGRRCYPSYRKLSLAACESFRQAQFLTTGLRD